jgi:hypothetical protein
MVSPKTGARCGKAARRDLRGGLVARPVPTATATPLRPAIMKSLHAWVGLAAITASPFLGLVAVGAASAAALR